MKLGRLIGRIGFVVGFVGPLLFYGSPASWVTYESHLLCPYCPIIDIMFADWVDWLLVGLKTGLLCGLLLALVGFSIGYAVSKVKSRLKESRAIRQVHP
jgi:hypothetical protein